MSIKTVTNTTCSVSTKINCIQSNVDERKLLWKSRCSYLDQWLDTSNEYEYDQLYVCLCLIECVICSYRYQCVSLHFLRTWFQLLILQFKMCRKHSKRALKSKVQYHNECEIYSVDIYKCGNVVIKSIVQLTRFCSEKTTEI